ncbi:F-box domain [Arabidopsis suecica]|uniref:F-box domain n=1 Tax=Arabidopsis suecica TaxID=45249 RepID=A0A8T2DGD6_ARASU|nr:F-box domain [Arabidopsis suecica]
MKFSAKLEKKRYTMQSQTNPNPSLPDDLILSCVARVSRLYYPTLSLVSKSFRSLIASPELYKTRSLLDRTESCLYVCIKLNPFDEKPRWFTLCRKHNGTLKSSGYVLATVPIPHTPLESSSSSIVSVCSSIYNIGGYKLPSSSVSILDCTSNTWREGPSLRVKLMSCTACVLDEKIYVSGRCKDGDSMTFQVFDTNTQTWDPLSVPCSETKHEFHYKIVSFDGKLHLVSYKGVDAYNSKEGRWDLVTPSIEHIKYLYDCYRKIGNVWYTVVKGDISTSIWWYHTEEREWRDLKGIVGLPKFPIDACLRMVDYGGKMAVLWDDYLPGRKKKMIWCAEIVLERRGSLEIWGKVEWFAHVLTAPRQYEFVKVLAATV